MNAGITEILVDTPYKLPEAHLSADKMAVAINEQTGFENIGIPFCMTVEAEVLGSTVFYGSMSGEPKVEKEIYPHT